MGFDDLPTIETVDKYLDLAFSKARKEAREYTLKDAEKGRRQQVLGLIKVKVIRDDLMKRFQTITAQYPNFDNLSEFYMQLLDATMDRKSLKKSLGAVNWATEQIKTMSTATIRGLRNAPDPNALVNSHYGRISSLLKQLKPELAYLHEVRQTLRNFPSVKEGLFTVCIAGFPNVGKSTLLSQVTPAKPEINQYAFTTKRLNLGYATKQGVKLQFIDTPGTLNRVEKMNDIELQAYLSMRYVADAIVYVFDLTEQSASLTDQEKLYQRVKKMDKPVDIYLSKSDLLVEGDIIHFKHDHFVDRDELMDKLFSLAKSN